MTRLWVTRYNMKFIFKWLRKKLLQVSESEYEADRVKDNPLIGGQMVATRFDSNGMNFTVNKANGGYVIQFSQYDRRTDRTDMKLHIITDDKDLGEELGKIISFEALRA